MNNFKETIVANARAMMLSDVSSKVVFNDTIALLKENKVTDVKSSIRGLVDDTKDVLSNDFSTNIINRVVKTVKLAGAWYGKKLFTKHEVLFMYNIEGGLRLLDALEALSKVDNPKVTEEDIKKVRNQLNRIKHSNDVSYNNDFEAKVKELMKEYNLVDIDGAIIQVETRIEKLWNEMDTKQREAFKAFIGTLA